MVSLFTDTRAPAMGSLRLAWNGSAFGLIWAATAAPSYDVAFARIGPDATNRWTATSHFDLTSGGSAYAGPNLAAGPEGFIVSYCATSDGRWLYTLLDASGAVVSSGGTQIKDKPFYSSASCPAAGVSLVWSPWRYEYVAAVAFSPNSNNGCPAT